jgi:hypothetical protein
MNGFKLRVCDSVTRKNEISVPLLCHFWGSRFRLLLRLVNVLLEYGPPGHSAGDCRLGCSTSHITDGSDVCFVSSSATSSEG